MAHKQQSVQSLRSPQIGQHEGQHIRDGGRRGGREYSTVRRTIRRRKGDQRGILIDGVVPGQIVAIAIDAHKVEVRLKTVQEMGGHQQSLGKHRAHGALGRMEENENRLKGVIK